MTQGIDNTARLRGQLDSDAALNSGGIIESPRWFGPTERPLFGWFVYPEHRRVRAAVVLCPPMAEEGVMAYRTFRALSRELAREGFLSLRFDYDGSGDSAGSFNDEGRREAWIGSVDHAVSESRAWGVDRVSMIGMRMGATAAYLACVERDLGVDDLVLWDPCATGHGFLRGLQLLQSPWLEGRGRAPEGWVETPSYRFSPQTAAELREFAIDGSGRAQRLARRVSAYARPDRSPSRAVIEALPRGEVQWFEAEEQHLLLDVPTIAAAVPTRTLHGIVQRIASAAGMQESVLHPRLSPAAEWTENGLPIREEATFFSDDRTLFGIRTVGSAQGVARPDLPRVLMLNVAAERHLGEGRLWVRLAREAAAEGFDSVRLDLSGVGDSGTRAGHNDDVIYDIDWLDDVPAVARELSPSGLPGVIGIGVSSTATAVVNAAERGVLREAIAVNISFGAGDLFQVPREWTRLPLLLRRLSIKHRRVALRLWGALGLLDPRRAPLRAPRGAIAGGSEVTVLSCPEDIDSARPSRLWRAIWGRKMFRSGRFRVIELPNADHSLRVGSGQEEAKCEILRRLRDHANRPATAQPQRGGRQVEATTPEVA